MSGPPPAGARRPAALFAGALALVVVACGLGGPLAPPKAYERYCVRCHGEDGRGDPKAVRLNDRLDLVAADMVRSRELADIEDRITRGKGAMPGFARKLEPEEIAALARFVVERFGDEASTSPPTSPAAASE